MARYVTVSSISFGGVPEGPANRKREAIDQVLGLIETAARDRPDVILLPETFSGLGCSEKEWLATAETVAGPTTRALGAKARRHRTYIIAGMVTQDGRERHNSCVIINRAGRVMGAYHKYYPTIGEIKVGITPGRSVPVFEADFGRFACLICFDLNFRELAAKITRGRADVVFFSSMFRGGLQMQIYAYEYRLFMVSATPAEDSLFVNPIGQVLASSSAYDRVVTRRLNLDVQVLHLDYNHALLPKLKGKYGPRVTFEVASPEGIFLLTSHHPKVSAAEMVKEFKLETLDRYFSRSRRARARALSG